MSSQTESNQPKKGGASDISAKEELNTHGSGEPSADNVNVSGSTTGYGKDNSNSDNDTKNPSGGASDISAKEELNTHGSGEPSADNVNMSS